MEVTLQISDKLLNKIKALNVLSGGGLNLDDVAVQMLDVAITQKLVGLLQVDLPELHAAQGPSDEYSDLTGISAGLGDPTPRGRPPRAKPPKEEEPAGGITDEALDHDMDLEDPDHEANFDAADASIDKTVAPENIFASTLGLPPPPPVKPSPRKGRARVTPMTS